MANTIIAANNSNTFKAIVLAAIITDEAGHIKCNLTDEEKRIIMTKRTAENAEVSESAKAFAEQVDIQATLDSLVAPGAQQNNLDVISDRLSYPRATEGKPDNVVDCAVAKTTNFCTARLIDDTIMKLYGGLEVTVQKGAREMTEKIRGLVKQDFFTKSEPTNVMPNTLTKKAAAGDVRLSGTVFPDGIVLADELNLVLQATVSLKQAMVAALYDQHKNPTADDKNDIICLYKNANRSALEDIFEAQYRALFGELKSDNAEQITEYVNMRSAYLQLLSAKYGNSLGGLTVDLGLRIRKQVISPNVIWTNTDKVRRVHRFQNGSYYVSSHVDAGLGKIPSTLDIIQEYSERIDDVVEASLIIIEAETRAEMGLPYDISKLKELNLDTTMLEGEEELFRTHLQINRSAEKAYEAELREAAMDAAGQVLRSTKANKMDDALNRLTNYQKGV